MQSFVVLSQYNPKVESQVKLFAQLIPDEKYETCKVQLNFILGKLIL